MRLARRDNSLCVHVNDDPPENGVRPSVDYLLRSVTETIGGDALAAFYDWEW